MALLTVTQLWAPRIWPLMELPVEATLQLWAIRDILRMARMAMAEATIFHTMPPNLCPILAHWEEIHNSIQRTSISVYLVHFGQFCLFLKMLIFYDFVDF